MTFPRWALALALLSACGGSTATSSGTGGSSASGGSGGSGGTGTGATSGTGGGGACVTDTDCPSNGRCGYPAADGCSAKGQCFPQPGMVCNAFSPGCACDGTTINVICTGLPDGYVSAPLAHAGDCATVDAGGSFPCGDSLTCDSATEYCKVGVGGPCCPPPSYSCEPIPGVCSQDRSCACIGPAVGGQLCDDSGGGVTVTFEYP
jgi:hypothetical protein